VSGINERTYWPAGKRNEKGDPVRWDWKLHLLKEQIHYDSAPGV